MSDDEIQTVESLLDACKMLMYSGDYDHPEACDCNLCVSARACIAAAEAMLDRAAKGE